jgi:hypothetical protein
MKYWERFSKRGNELVEQLMKLDWEEQLDITEFVQDLYACPPGIMSADDPRWPDELARRLDDLKTGKSKTVDGQEFMDSLRKKYGDLPPSERFPGERPDWLDRYREELAVWGDDLRSFQENHFRTALCHAILNQGLRAFAEYPYYESTEECDVAIACRQAWRQVESWIEFKPVQYDSHYWNPSKFEIVFRHDIEKLSKCHEKRYFLMFVESHDYDLIVSEVKPVRRGKHLSIPQMKLAISKWAGGSEPFTCEPFPIGDHHGHLFLWPVTEFVFSRLTP